MTEDPAEDKPISVGKPDPEQDAFVPKISKTPNPFDMLKMSLNKTQTRLRALVAPPSKKVSAEPPQNQETAQSTGATANPVPPSTKPAAASLHPPDIRGGDVMDSILSKLDFSAYAPIRTSPQPPSAPPAPAVATAASATAAPAPAATPVPATSAPSSATATPVPATYAPTSATAATAPATAMPASAVATPEPPSSQPSGPPMPKGIAQIFPKRVHRPSTEVGSQVTLPSSQGIPQALAPPGPPLPPGIPQALPPPGPPFPVGVPQALPPPAPPFPAGVPQALPPPGPPLPAGIAQALSQPGSSAPAAIHPTLPQPSMPLPGIPQSAPTSASRPMHLPEVPSVAPPELPPAPPPRENPAVQPGSEIGIEQSPAQEVPSYSAAPDSAQAHPALSKAQFQAATAAGIGETELPALFHQTEPIWRQRERRVRNSGFLTRPEKQESNSKLVAKIREKASLDPEKLKDSFSWLHVHGIKIVSTALIILLLFASWQLAQMYFSQVRVDEGMKEYATGKYDRALSLYNQAVSLNPRNAAAYYQRGRVYTKQHQFHKAYQEYSKALILDGQNLAILDHRAALSLFIGDNNLAVNDYTYLIAKSKDKDKRAALINRATAYIQMGLYREAIGDYNAILKANPKDLEPMMGVAFCQERLGRHQEAINEYSLIIKHEPHNQEAYLERGWCNQKYKKYAQAQSDYQAVLSLNPRSQRALLYRAGMYGEQKQWDKAIQDLNTALHLNPTYTEALQLRASMYSGKGDYQKAVDDYTRLAAMPDIARKPDVFFDRADIYKKMKDFKKAAQDYGKAAELLPNSPLPHLRRATCYTALKEYKKAIADCSYAAKLSPKNVDVYMERGAILHQFGNEMSAYRDFSFVLSLNKLNTRAYILRAQCLLAQRDSDAALLDLERALKIDPNNAEALAFKKQCIAASGGSRRIASTQSRSPATISAKQLHAMDTAALVEEGYSRMNTGSTQDAVLLLSEAVRRNPNDAKARRYLAWAFLQNNQPNDALSQFSTVRRMGAFQPSDNEGMQRALTMRSGDSHKARSQVVISQYQAQLSANPSDVSTRYNLAEEYAKAGMTQAALSECEKGMNQTPYKSAAQQRFYNFYTSLKSSAQRNLWQRQGSKSTVKQNAGG